jgi:hypothetical protein
VGTSLSIECSTTAKDMLLSIFEGWDPYLRQSPLYLLLKSIKGGTIELDYETVKSGVEEIIGYWVAEED